MILYADRPGRRLLQVAADCAVVGWVAGCIAVGRAVYAATIGLASPAHQLSKTGEGFRDRMSTAAGALDNLPVVNDRLATPFRSAASTGQELRETGEALASAVERLATILGWVSALVPLVLVLGLWLSLRGRFVRQATAARALIDADADLDLFALRAMARQPMHRLARISNDPAGAWRRRDAPIVRALATLELGDAGLRPPAEPAHPDLGR